LARIGADNRLGTGDYRIAQRWSHVLWVHPDEPDGMFYRSRHDPSRTCLAIFDRAADAVSASNVGSFVERAHLALLAEILDAYDIGYLD
jgi:RES domain